MAVVIIYRQMDFIQSRHLGYEKDNVITFEKQGLDSGFDAFLAEARNIPGVVNVSSAHGSITNVTNTSWGIGGRDNYPVARRSSSMA